MDKDYKSQVDTYREWIAETACHIIREAYKLTEVGRLESIVEELEVLDMTIGKGIDEE